MKVLDFYWNKNNHIFRYDKKWVLYAGETGNFLELSDKEKQNLDSFIGEKKKLPEPLFRKLMNTEAISIKTEQEFENIAKYRLLKKQVSSVLSVSMCPCAPDSEKILDEKYLDGIIHFCERKNQKNIRFFWNCSDIKNILPLVENISSKLEKKGIFIYNGLVSNSFVFSELELDKLKKLRFNNFQILLKTCILKSEQELYDFLTFIELSFNFYKRVFYKPIFNILCEISDKTYEKIKELKEYFASRYGDFFNLDITNYADIYECRNKINSEIFSDSELENTIEYDKKLNNYERMYLKKVSSVFSCHAQTISAFIIDWDGNVLKCWNDLGNKHKSIYSLETGRPINLEIEYKYLMTNSYTKIECNNCYLKNQCNGGCCHEKKQCELTNKIKDFYFLREKRQFYYEI